MSTIETQSRPPFSPDHLDGVCAVEADRTLTWRQWNDEANRLASSLHALGLGAGDVIAVRMHSRLEWLTISLAIAKLQAVIVAVNYKLTAPESLYILRDCSVKAAIVDDADPTELLRGWGELGLAAVISLDNHVAGALDYQTLIDDGDTAHRAADDLAPLIIYSSGTTGAPKGAPLNNWQTPPDPQTLGEYQMSVAFDGECGGPGNRTLINIPMHHGAGPAYTRIALASGGTVVFQRAFSAEGVLQLIDSEKITHWIAVPTMLQRILKLPPAVRNSHDMASLRFVLGGAAPFHADLKRQAMEYFGDVLYEIYGSTEAGMIAGSKPRDLRKHPSTSGHAFRHVDIKIIDDEGRTAAPLVTGEIAVRTPVVIDGYIGRGPLGADKVDDAGYYRTGDVGHLDADGYLFISDRITDMIIAGGVNIYPAEIEAALITHPAVAGVAVIGVPNADHGEQPHAFVQTTPGAALTHDQLLAYCEGRLAKYKWPRGFDFIEEIPTNPMGKTLKRVLREQYSAQLQTKESSS